MKQKKRQERKPLPGVIAPEMIAQQMTGEDRTHAFRWNLLCLAILGVWIIVAYHNNLRNELLFDDKVKILENPAIRTFQGAMQNRYRFVTNLSYHLNYSWTGLDPVSYRITHIVLHIFTVWTLFWLALLWLPRTLWRRWIAFLIALVFALHPLNTEAVDYQNARQILLCTLFSLLSLVSFIKAFPREGPLPSLRRQCIYLGISVVALVLGIFSRETAAAMIAVMGLYSLAFLSRDRRAFTFALSFLGVLCLLGAIGIWYYRLVPLVATPENFFEEFSIYWVTQSVVALKYLGLALLPLPSQLNVDHEMDLVKQFDVLSVASLALIMAIVPVMVLLWRRNRLLTLAIFWILVCHAPTFFVVRSDFMVEYRNYMPMIGLAILVVLLLEKIALRVRHGYRIMAGFVIALSLFYTWCIYERNKAWATEETLWADTIVKSPNKARAHVGVAMGHLKDLQVRLPEQEALLNERHNKKEISDTEFIQQLQALGAKKVEAVKKGLERIETAVQKMRNYYQGYPVGAAFCFYKEDFPEAIRWCDRMIREIEIEGRPYAYTRALAEAYNVKGAALQRMGKNDEAVRSFKESLKHEPFTQAYQNLASYFVVTGQYDEATKYIQEYMGIDPRDPVMNVLARVVSVARDSSTMGTVVEQLRGMPRKETRALLERIAASTPDGALKNMVHLMLMQLPRG